ncbi:Oidioi.mRNA.OKI2018_I69.YSR.g17207.t1.cds [Oikopleura dioica]|uniref:Oidioi.mRNA.OKI2018_I69.YSR.g17207.t1.cds n=1 Tax=Oikopleura dioica TaxID=34765 RepID=A0ABN7SIH3_OIKDI|nr:Oidioi.mRNA.OKI2018_I69.YSR.g17207.t1.cds [Oikopleura dioica]
MRNLRAYETIEALQQILRGKALSICRELQLDESTSSKILLLLREMWFTYLSGRLLCFGSDSNPVNFRDRDLHMYRAIKNDGFNGLEKTSYDPMQYKKTPKDVELGIYSAGNNTHFEFTSSDSEPEAQVALNRVKKLKRKRKTTSVNYERVSLPDVQAIIFLGFRVLGYPISFKSIFKHCFIDEVKNYFESATPSVQKIGSEERLRHECRVL